MHFCCIVFLLACRLAIGVHALIDTTRRSSVFPKHRLHHSIRTPGDLRLLWKSLAAAQKQPVHPTGRGGSSVESLSSRRGHARKEPKALFRKQAERSMPKSSLLERAVSSESHKGTAQESHSLLMECGRDKRNLIKPGDIIGGYRVKRCLGAGFYADVMLVSPHSNSSAEAVMKLYKPWRNYTTQDLYSECVFARLAKQKTSAQVSDCLDVGRADAYADASRFLIMEIVPGQNLASLANMTHPPAELHRLDQIFDVSWEIYDMLGKWRNPGNGVSLWHLDLLLYNLMLDVSSGHPLLSAIDFNMAKMCCLDSDCKRVILDLEQSMQKMSCYSSDRIDLFEIIKPCSLLDASIRPLESSHSPTTQRHSLDAKLIQTWVRNTVSLVMEGGVTYADWLRDIRWPYQKVRQDYSNQWWGACGHNGAACQSFLQAGATTYRWAASATYPPKMKPQWPKAIMSLVSNFLVAKNSLGNSSEKQW